MPSNTRRHATAYDVAPVNSALLPSRAGQMVPSWRGSRAECRPLGGFCGSAAVAAVAGGVGVQGREEVDLAEGRPEDLTEVVLRVGRLPQHETGQPLLAAGADHEVGVGLGA